MPRYGAEYRAKLVAEMANLPAFTARATEEMVEKNIQFADTEAGRALQSEIELLQKQLQDLEKAMKEKTEGMEALEKQVHEEVTNEEENVRSLKEKLEKEMEDVKEKAKAEQKRLMQVLVDEQTASDNRLSIQRGETERTVKEIMDQASAERGEIQRRTDNARAATSQNLNWHIQRLESRINEEANARRGAESRATVLQSKVSSLEWDLSHAQGQLSAVKKEIKRAERAWDSLTDDLLKAGDREERLRKRIQKLRWR